MGAILTSESGYNDSGDVNITSVEELDTDEEQSGSSKTIKKAIPTKVAM